MKRYIVFIAMLWNFLYSQNGIIKKIYTDKTIYNYGEKIIITIRAINTTQLNYTLVLPSSCEPYPYIDTLNYLVIFEMGCAAALAPYTIFPNDTVEWTREYPHYFNPTKYLSIGKHKIFGYFKSTIPTSDTIEIEVISTPNSVKESQTVDGYSLFNNYPNPFNPATTISFNLQQQSYVTLIISDVLGKKIEVLIDRPVSSGLHKVKWEPNRLSSGVYFCTLIVNGKRDVRKLIYTR